MKIELGREELEEAVGMFLRTKSFYFDGKLNITVTRGGVSVVIVQPEPDTLGQCDAKCEAVCDTEDNVSTSYEESESKEEPSATSIYATS